MSYSSQEAEDDRRLAEYARLQIVDHMGGRGVRRLPIDSIPGYELICQLRRGGQGEVYEALQKSTKRRVAIKLLHHGPWANARSKARFDQEIEVLAKLRHPNIVAIHDGGVSACGRHYFVMDVIDGQPIDEWLAEQEAGVRELLSVFRKVCDAVNAAHLHGIAHRDLKPSNVLVDASGEPYVLDFGLAKLVLDEIDAIESADRTFEGEFLGSIPWASPEQADCTPGLIDLRSDVYSLGVMLFRILTGHTPYAIVGPLPEVLSNIRSFRPPRPSVFRREINDEVDTIVLTCLNKERERRYQSAGELARDIERYLHGEPIEAKRDSTWYCLTKWIARHRGAAVGLVIVAALTVAYSIGVTFYYRRAVVGETRARESAAVANDTLQAMDGVYEKLLKRIRESALTPDSVAVQRELSDEAYQTLRRFVDQTADNARHSAGFALVLSRLAEFAITANNREEALAYFREAAAIRERLVKEDAPNLDSRATLSVNLVRIGDTLKELGDVQGCKGLYERALQLDEALLAAAPSNGHFLDNLAWSYERLGALAEGRGEKEVALAYYAKQLDAAKRAYVLAPNNASRQRTVAVAERRWFVAKQPSNILLEDALTRLEAARWSLECEPSNEQAMLALGTAEQLVATARADSRARSEALRPLVEKAKAEAQQRPGDPAVVWDMINWLAPFAHQAHDAGFMDEAREATELAITHATNLVVASPSWSVEYALFLASLHARAGQRSLGRGDVANALYHAQMCWEVADKALATAPEDAELLLQGTRCLDNLASILLESGRTAEAELIVERIVSLSEQALQSGYMTAEFQFAYGRILTGAEAQTYRDTDRGLRLMEKVLDSPELGGSSEYWRDQLVNAAAAAGRMDVACHMLSWVSCD